MTGALIVLVIANQPIFADTVDRPTADAARLPGFRPERRLLVPPAAVYVATPALLLVLGVFAVAKLPIWPLTAIVAVVTAGTAVVGAQALRVRIHGVRRSGREIHSALAAFDASFALHFSAPDNTEYHVAMWQPYLERIGRRWIIVAARAQAVRGARAYGAARRTGHVLPADRARRRGGHARTAAGLLRQQRHEEHATSSGSTS